MEIARGSVILGFHLVTILIVILALLVHSPISGQTCIINPSSSYAVFGLNSNEEADSLMERSIPRQNSDLFTNATPFAGNGTPVLSTIENGSIPVVWQVTGIKNPSFIIFELADVNSNGTLLKDCVVYVSENGERNVSNILERTNSPIRRVKANFTLTNLLSRWYIVFHPRGQNGSYTITAKDYSSGYSFTTAKSLLEGTQYNETFYFASNSHFWNITLNGGQRAIVRISAEDESVINGLTAVWQDSPTSSKRTFENDGNDEPWEFHFKSPKQTIQTYFLVLRHGDSSEGASVGQYQISVQLTTSGYNFSVAYNLDQSNLTLIHEIKYPDDRPYFKFHVDDRTRVTIRAEELEADLLEQARIEVFAPDGETTVAALREEDGADGEILGSFLAESIGTYYFYLEIVAFSPFSPGSLNITVILSPSPKQFSWRWEAQIVTLAFFSLIPLLLFYQRRKFGAQRFQWNVGAPASKVYRTLFDSGRFEIYGMIPDRLLKTRSKILGIKCSCTILLDSIEREESLIRTSRKPRLWENILPLLIMLSFYILLNSFILLWSREDHFLPFEIKSTFQYFLGGSIFIITSLLLIGLALLRRKQREIFGARIEEIIHSMIKRHNGVPVSEEQRKMFIEKQMERNIAYVRVLWNQAKAACKEQNFNLFVIKADAAVKKLLETRFMQIYGYTEFNSPIEFRVLCERLRIAGFDIPKTKKIEHHRKLRNYIVHSSRILDEDESAETLAYYTKFLGRLGLRA
ncbi:MAG: hypothetical protein ACFFB3_17760 [Candidatus Hodarchaeota archaeon]